MAELTQQIQSVAFLADQWNPRDACTWLKAHRMTCGKFDRAKNEFRFRQFSPRKCDGGFSSAYRLSRYDVTGRRRPLPKGFRLIFCSSKPVRRRKKKQPMELRGVMQSTKGCQRLRPQDAMRLLQSRARKDATSKTDYAKVLRALAIVVKKGFCPMVSPYRTVCYRKRDDTFWKCKSPWRGK